jgi:hypothetical protein
VQYLATALSGGSEWLVVVHGAVGGWGVGVAGAGIGFWAVAVVVARSRVAFQSQLVSALAPINRGLFPVSISAG